MVSLEDDIVQSFEHAMIFKSFLDSLCKGGAEVLGASASPSGSRPSDQAQLHGPDALRFDPSRGDA